MIADAVTIKRNRRSETEIAPRGRWIGLEIGQTEAPRRKEMESGSKDYNRKEKEKKKP